MSRRPHLFGRWRLVRAACAVAAFVVDLWVWGGDTRTWDGAQVPVFWVVLVAVVAYACLAVWRSPVPGYLALWLLSLVGISVPATESFAGYLLALFLMARLMPRSMAVVALISSAAPIAANTITGASFHDESDPVFLLLNLGLWSLLMLGVWAAGRMLARNDRRLETERQWSEAARAEAITAERLRISREMHDTVAHSLTGIVLQAAGARAGLVRGTASEEELGKALSSIQHASEQSMRELHRLLGMLRETEQSEIRGDGIEQLDQLIDSATATGLDVVFRTSGTPVEVDQSIAHAAYRAVQEGLSNVMKHAGPGARVEVTCDWLPKTLSITVHDAAGIAEHPAAAPGPAVPSGGFGLVGLRERVSVCGGTMEGGSTEHGFVLQVRLPTSDLPPAHRTKGSGESGLEAEEPGGENRRAL